MKKTLVAIFEDDMVNRYIYERMFSGRSDITLFQFDQLEAGLNALQTQSFDMVFIEAHFYENFGGINVLKKMQASLDVMPTCIAITSLLQKGDLEKLMGAGFMLCLEKPIVFNQILPERLL